MSTTTSEAAEHVRKAGEHLREAARTWADQVVKPEVRSHLRDAARSVLNAGLAAVDAAERCDRERQQQRAKPAAPDAAAAPTA